MAYISTDEVKEIRNQLKSVLKSKGIIGTVKREHQYVVVLSVESNGKLINEFEDEKFNSYNFHNNWLNFTEEDKSKYFKFQARRREIEKEIAELEDALTLPIYRDNTDVMNDYFDYSYYTDIKILN